MDLCTANATVDAVGLSRLSGVHRGDNECSIGFDRAEIVSRPTKQAGSIRSGSVLQFALKSVF
jgi:hypothetical protein